MFATPLQSHVTTPEVQPAPMANTPHQYSISDYGYGKDSVKVLHVKRNGPVHSIKEFEVGTHLKLYSQKDYYHGKNGHTLKHVPHKKVARKVLLSIPTRALVLSY